MILEIPNKLNGNTFYGEILPSIYKSITQGDYLIDFDMHRTELANPEGLVNFLAAAAMIRSKSGYIPQLLYLPESPNLFEYMRKAGFFKWAMVPGCESLRLYGGINVDSSDVNKQSNYFRPQLFGLYTHSDDGTTFNRHIRHIEDFVIEIADSLTEDKVDSSEKSRYCRLLSLSLVQVIKNSLEHNKGYRGTLAYYMIQKTPYNTIEFAFSDIGQGFLERMKKMLKENDEEAIKKYGDFERKLNNQDMLFKENDNNPNLLAIIKAVDYRENSEIPGLHKIKTFLLKYGKLFSIHSGNYSVEYELIKMKKNEKEIMTRTIFHDRSYFSGCHLKIVFSLPKSTKQKQYGVE